MEAKAIAKQVRIAPRKARIVIDLIRGKQVGEALAILRLTPKAASPVIEKVLKSAIANAEHNYEMEPNNLVIKQAFVDEGITLKDSVHVRWVVQAVSTNVLATSQSLFLKRRRVKTWVKK